MITYSTNMMGPVSMSWYRERGLTKTVREVLLLPYLLITPAIMRAHKQMAHMGNTATYNKLRLHAFFSTHVDKNHTSPYELRTMPIEDYTIT